MKEIVRFIGTFSYIPAILWLYYMIALGLIALI